MVYDPVYCLAITESLVSESSRIKYLHKELTTFFIVTAVNKTASGFAFKKCLFLIIVFFYVMVEDTFKNQILTKIFMKKILEMDSQY